MMIERRTKRPYTTIQELCHHWRRYCDRYDYVVVDDFYINGIRRSDEVAQILFVSEIQLGHYSTWLLCKGCIFAVIYYARQQVFVKGAIA